ncbi:MAG: hypothetical protein HC884_05755 [Chloroflexaceae bacterium]|nr:hypothetical protein [Chloroflexaceae bacterium]
MAGRFPSFQGRSHSHPYVISSSYSWWNRTLAALVPAWPQGILVLGCAALMALLAQAPFTCSFIVGKERGSQSDLPFVQNVHQAESRAWWSERWRWSWPEWTITVPGVGQRRTIVTMEVVSHRAQWVPEAPPTVLTIRAGPRTTLPLTLRRERARYHFYLPAHALTGGTLRLDLATPAWQHPDDRREHLGVAVGGEFRVESTRSGGLVLPDPGIVAAWSLSLVLLWWALRLLSFAPMPSFWMLLPLSIALPVLARFEAPRLGFGNGWAIQIGLMSVGTAAACAWGIPPVLRRLRVLPRDATLRWLLLLVAISFITKYGGRLYPEAMPGDLQLHVNRSTGTLLGNLYLEAQHRGLPFPFPNGPYLLLFPFIVLGFDLRFLLQVSLGVYEAATVVLLYVLLARATGHERWGVLAAALYALTSGGFMNTWFMFHTQVAAQAFSMLLLTVIIVAWPDYARWPTWGVLAVLFALVFLGHIGLFLNTALVGLLIIPLLWWRTRSGSGAGHEGCEERRGVWQLTGAGLAAALFAFLFYYSAFLGLVIEQVAGVAAHGLNEATGKPPIPRETTLRVLWEGGLITHFGLFPILLALPGSLRIGSNRRLRSSILPPLLWLTFLVSFSQAGLPLLTLNSITTRWLMFSSWAIAVTGAAGYALLWRKGRAGRMVALTTAGYAAWLTIGLNLEALALRQPPIEPF